MGSRRPSFSFAKATKIQAKKFDPKNPVDGGQHEFVTVDVCLATTPLKSVLSMSLMRGGMELLTTTISTRRLASDDDEPTTDKWYAPFLWGILLIVVCAGACLFQAICTHHDPQELIERRQDLARRHASAHGGVIPENDNLYIDPMAAMATRGLTGGGEEEEGGEHEGGSGLLRGVGKPKHSFSGAANDYEDDEDGGPPSFFKVKVRALVPRPPLFKNDELTEAGKWVREVSSHLEQEFAAVVGPLVAVTDPAGVEGTLWDLEGGESGGGGGTLFSLSSSHALNGSGLNSGAGGGGRGGGSARYVLLSFTASTDDEEYGEDDLGQLATAGPFSVRVTLPDPPPMLVWGEVKQDLNRYSAPAPWRFKIELRVALPEVKDEAAYERRVASFERRLRADVAELFQVMSTYVLCVHHVCACVHVTTSSKYACYVCVYGVSVVPLLSSFEWKV